MSCTALMQFLMKATNLFSKHGPRVSSSNKIIRGPTKEDMRAVNQGDELNQDSHQFLRHCSFSFSLTQPFSYLGQGLPDYPPSDSHKNNVLPLTQHIGPLRDFILKILFGNWGGGLFLL